MFGHVKQSVYTVWNRVFAIMKQSVRLKETKYFKQMRKDNVTLLKIKWL